MGVETPETLDLMRLSVQCLVVKTLRHPRGTLLYTRNKCSGTVFSGCVSHPDIQYSHSKHHCASRPRGRRHDVEVGKWFV
jgi:hypothetical protein